MAEQGKQAKRPVPTICAWVAGLMALTACSSGPAENPASSNTAQPSALAAINSKELNGQESQIVRRLLRRDSVIPASSSFASVSRAVLASDARVGEAELRAARLRAQAESKNWLPQIGPIISLTSLGDIVAQILVQQVLYDNGRRKAERQFAAHDVEATAVSLSEMTNQRVSTALSLYVNVQKAREQGRLAQDAQRRMQQFVSIIQRRVDGGVSNLADLRVAQAKLNELNAEAARAQEEEATNLAELEAMTRTSMANVDGLTSLTARPSSMDPLNVLMAYATGDRSIAQSVMARADMLPTAILTGGIGGDAPDIGINISGDQLIGAGTGAA
ncbi:MAG: TolC family protein, partial [Pseudomonadota bacterium]